MADLQSALATRLESIVPALGERIYWSKVPQSAAYPYVRMQTVSDPRPQHLQGYQSSRTVRVQIDVMSSRYGEARSVCEAIITAVSNRATVAGVTFGRGKVTGPRDLGEDTPNGFIHRLSMDLLAEHSIA